MAGQCNNTLSSGLSPLIKSLCTKICINCPLYMNVCIHPPMQGLSGETAPLLNYRPCSDIPTCMGVTHGVFYHNQLYLGGQTNNSKTDSMLYVYCPDIDIWKVLPPSPLKWFAMAVWRDQLVLLGGKEANSKTSTLSNKVVVWEGGQWEPSLPPMLNARVSPLVMAHENYLALAGGRNDLLGRSVEVLESNRLQWCTVSSLPMNCYLHTSAKCGHYIYLLHLRTGRILQATISAFVTQKEEACLMRDSSSLAVETESISSEMGDFETGSIWSPIPKPPVIPLRLTTVGGYIVVFCRENKDEDFTVHGYFPETHSWCLVGRLPAVSSSAACITSPEKELFIAGGDSSSSKYSHKLYQATITVTT